tara:strand:+ start:942 stop:1151 length:210 start_codon:yes stop_codon:yes gene_type:complete
MNFPSSINSLVWVNEAGLAGLECVLPEYIAAMKKLNRTMKIIFENLEMYIEKLIFLDYISLNWSGFEVI